MNETPRGVSFTDSLHQKRSGEVGQALGKVRMSPRCLHLEVFKACQTGRRTGNSLRSSMKALLGEGMSGSIYFDCCPVT